MYLQFYSLKEEPSKNHDDWVRVRVLFGSCCVSVIPIFSPYHIEKVGSRLGGEKKTETAAAVTSTQLQTRRRDVTDNVERLSGEPAAARCEPMALSVTQADNRFSAYISLCACLFVSVRLGHTTAGYDNADRPAYTSNADRVLFRHRENTLAPAIQRSAHCRARLSLPRLRC